MKKDGFSIIETSDQFAVSEQINWLGDNTVKSKEMNLPLDKTFEALQGINLDPTMSYIHEHQDDIRKYILTPMEHLFSQIKISLSASIINFMETNKGIFYDNPFHRNKWGHGNEAWNFYWGSFYPKGGDRSSDGQLFIWINYERLEIGFSIGDSGTNQRKRFIKNFLENQKVLERLFIDEDNNIKVYCREDITTPMGPVNIKNNNDFIPWNKWLRQPDKSDIYASVFMTKDKLLKTDQEYLMDTIIETFQKLFPLVILSTMDNPMPIITKYLYPSKKNHEKMATYTLEDCVKDIKIDKDILARWVRAIERKKQVIFYGPPGTGKTKISKLLAKHIVSGTKGLIDIVQFHPSYAYEDFIQGIRPRTRPDGQLDYVLVQGRLLEFCKKAHSHDGKCVLIIDEINRANLSRVFGELMYLLEYRNEVIPLAGGGYLYLPDNIRIIGTMNTADRSLALVDHALRRRFAFLYIGPDYNILRRYHKNPDFKIDGLIEVLEEINNRIGDSNYFIGISYFLLKDLKNQIKDIWQMEIEPYLEEIFFDQEGAVNEFCWEKVFNKILND